MTVFQLALLHAFETNMSIWDCIFAVLCCVTTLSIFSFSSRILSRFASCTNLDMARTGITGMGLLGSGFDAFQKATISTSLAEPEQASRWLALENGQVDSGLVSHCIRLHACTETRVSACCPIPRDVPTYGPIHRLRPWCGRWLGRLTVALFGCG